MMTQLDGIYVFEITNGITKRFVERQTQKVDISLKKFWAHTYQTKD